MKIDVRLDQRFLLMGATGTGKTVFAKFLLRPISLKVPVVIIDEKNNWLGSNPIWEEDKKKPGTIDKPHLITRFNPQWNVQVFQSDGYDEDLDRLCHDVFKFTGIYFYIDDNDGLCTANHVPKGFRKIWKQGRALNIGAGDSAQEMTGYPTTFRKQSEKIVLFRVDKADAKEAAKLVNVDEEEVEQLANYEWIYYDKLSMTSGLFMPPIPYKEKTHATKAG